MIKKYIANRDTTITNAYRYGGASVIRATGSNIGGADSLEVYSLFGNYASGSVEKSRILVQFDTSKLTADRNAGAIPASGSVDFYFNLYNVRHVSTLPRDFTLIVAPISQSWDEGYGLDLDDYTDPGIGFEGKGATWVTARTSSAGAVSWSVAGADILDNPIYSQSFVDGTEDLRVDITGLVERWLGGTLDNNGVAVYLTSSQENNSSSVSYYTKKFSARSSEYFFLRPSLEATWDDSKKDQRGLFYPSSSAMSSADNLNTIYFYNYVRGQLKDLPNVGQGELYVTLHTSASAGEQITSTPNSPVTGGWVETGVYSASFALNTSASVVYDRWYSGSTYYHTGCLIVKDDRYNNIATRPEYTVKVNNLKSSYTREEVPRVRLYTRRRNWNPNLYVKASSVPNLDIIEDVFYRVVRVADDREIIGFGTGSNETRLSYDASGSYFDFDMDYLQKNYSYKFEFMIYENGEYKVLPYSAKFRVE